MPLTIAICDDNENQIQELLKTFFSAIPINLVTCSCLTLK